ncbi:MAG: SCO6745 family protein [Acidimicrobiales bacterium]
MDPALARKTWRTVEPLHAMIYFVPEAGEEYGAAGLEGSRMGYFASRAAAFGPAPAEVVIATFYNFEPSLVRRAIPRAWSLASPADLLLARRRAADRALRRGLGEDLADSDSVVEAAALVRRAAEAACEHPEGRPLFAAHASLAWPEEPLLDLWHGQTLLREFRGDGHVAALLLADIGPVEALVLHEASGEIPPGFLQVSRAWDDSEWAAAVERLRDRGLLTSAGALGLSPGGAALRQRVEDETDARALAPYRALGAESCDRLRDVARPLSKAVVANGLMTPDLSRLADL